MQAVKTMTFDLTDLSRRCEAARGYVPRRSTEPTPGARARRAMLISLGVAACSVLTLVGLLFASAILDF
jgi:hypothetical protein